MVLAEETFYFDMIYDFLRLAREEISIAWGLFWLERGEYWVVSCTMDFWRGLSV